MDLQTWFNQNMPDEKEMAYATAAINQIIWVRDHFDRMVFSTLKALGTFIEVAGTHMSKSVLLPVYRFEANGVTIKARGNFHDWNIKVWADAEIAFPDYFTEAMFQGYSEGMPEKAPIEFSVARKDEMYAIVWWLLAEIMRQKNGNP